MEPILVASITQNKCGKKEVVNNYNKKEIFDRKRKVPSRRGEREVQLAGRYSWSTLP